MPSSDAPPTPTPRTFTRTHTHAHQLPHAMSASSARSPPFTPPPARSTTPCTHTPSPCALPKTGGCRGRAVRLLLLHQRGPRPRAAAARVHAAHLQDAYPGGAGLQDLAWCGGGVCVSGLGVGAGEGVRLISKMPTLAALAYKTSRGASPGQGVSFLCRRAALLCCPFACRTLPAHQLPTHPSCIAHLFRCRPYPPPRHAHHLPPQRPDLR